jgi:hypothetical protein
MLDDPAAGLRVFQGSPRKVSFLDQPSNAHNQRLGFVIFHSPIVAG